MTSESPSEQYVSVYKYINFSLPIGYIGGQRNSDPLRASFFGFALVVKARDFKVLQILI